jgi:hypothetical protein
MPTPLGLTSRLHIEWLLLRLDLHLGSLPGRARRSIRRELRMNLHASAREVGAGEAVRRLGGLRRLADGYLDAAYAGRRRPNLLKAVFWLVAVECVLLGAGFLSHQAFIAGVDAASSRPDGVFAWTGLEALGIGGEVTYADGEVRAFSLTFNLWMLLYLALAFTLGGRCWRLLPNRSRVASLAHRVSST